MPLFTCFNDMTDSHNDLLSFMSSVCCRVLQSCLCYQDMPMRLKLNELFTLDDNNRGTRGHSWKLAKFRCTRDCCKYFFQTE